MDPPSGASAADHAPACPDGAADAPARFPRLPVARRTGDEPLHDAGRPRAACLIDFWRWAYSDLLHNVTRGVLAEYLVADALGLTLDVRDPWAGCDLVAANGARIEVRSAAYVQAWAQRRDTAITFSVRASKRWDADTGAYDPDVARNADVYVFALHKERDRTKVEPLDVAQWEYHVLAARSIDERRPDAQSLTLAALGALGAVACGHDSLAQTVERVHASSSRS